MPPSPVTMRPDASIPGFQALFERYDFTAFLEVDERGVLRSPVCQLNLLRVFHPDWHGGGRRIGALEAASAEGASVFSIILRTATRFLLALVAVFGVFAAARA